MKRLHVKIGDRTLLVQVNEITHFESADKYTTVHLNEKEYIIDNPLIELEKKLDPSLFLRIHRSLLVNTSWISEIHRNLGGKLQVQLKNDAKTRLGVSRSFVDKVKNL
jgi:two-component system LytT family response regulator